MNELAETLRREIAAAHQLPPGAAEVLVGSTLAELERSADALAKLVTGSEGREPKQAEPASDLFAGSAREKARRQRALVEALHRRPRQQRDERGRFAARSVSFDGGARTPVPPKPESHNEWLARRLVDARAHRSSGGW